MISFTDIRVVVSWLVLTVIAFMGIDGNAPDYVIYAVVAVMYIICYTVVSKLDSSQGERVTNEI